MKKKNALEKQFEDMFAQIIVDIKKKDDAFDFFNDFFSKKELDIISKRLAIGYWLKKGRSYENIKKNIKTSSATIANVQKMLEKKGFNKAIMILEADEWANKWTQRIKQYIK